MSWRTRPTLNGRDTYRFLSRTREPTPRISWRDYCRKDRKKRVPWAIEHAGSAIGGTNIRFDFENHVGTLGYSVARRHWGKGLATEAVGAVIDESFSTYPDLNRIQASADERNAGSLRVMEKLGMVREGVLRQDQYLRGEFRNTVWCGLLRCEWEARKKR